MEFGRVRPDVVKYEIRQLSGQPIDQAQQRKRGGFGRFLSGIGRVLGAIAAPLSFFFPPAALGAAAAYGVSKVGDMVQVRAAQKTVEEQSGQQPMGQVFIPGLTDMAMDVARDPVRSFNPAVQARDQQASRVLIARNEMMAASAHHI